MLKVLIVEDNLMLADMLENLLVSQGYDVCGIACTVSEAVALADRCHPDLAIIDYRLGEGGYGTQILPLLREKTKMGILYASGNDLKNELNEEDGDAFISKPYPIHDLLKALKIVRQVKMHEVIIRSLFPKNFHLLDNSIVSKSHLA